MNDFRGKVLSSETTTRRQQIINPLSTSKDHAVDFTDEKFFIRRLTLRSMWIRLGRLREDMELPWSSCLRNI